MKNFLTWINGIAYGVVIVPTLALLLFMVALPAITIIAATVELIFALTCPRKFVEEYTKHGPKILFREETKK